MDHVIAMSTLAYVGTTHEKDFIIYHDALSTWWEQGAQEHMAARGFRDRQWRCLGSTNADTRYALKLVGDSPELCRALDAHGFADLGNAINYHVSVSCSQYAVGDARRFEMGTPPQVWSTMSRCWTVAPTSARIIEDIDALPGVLEKIIAANGCVVHDEFLRTGRRAVSRDGARLTRNARSRQRIETCRACPRHPDIEAALTELRANLQGRAVRQRP